MRGKYTTARNGDPISFQTKNMEKLPVKNIEEMSLNELEALQAKHRKQMKENREKVNARKARTHRLIVRGAIAESFFADAQKMTDKQFEDTLRQLIFG